MHKSTPQHVIDRVNETVRQWKKENDPSPTDRHPDFKRKPSLPYAMKKNTAPFLPHPHTHVLAPEEVMIIMNDPANPMSDLLHLVSQMRFAANDGCMLCSNAIGMLEAIGKGHAHHFSVPQPDGS